MSTGIIARQQLERQPQRVQPKLDNQGQQLPLRQNEPAIIGKSPTSAGRTVIVAREPLLESGPTLTGYLLERSKEAQRYEKFIIAPGFKSSKGLEVVAGVVSSGESLVNPRTPFLATPSFIGGSIFGSLIIGYGFSKVTEPITSPFTKALSEKLTKLLNPKDLLEQKEMPSDYLSFDKDLSLREKLTPIKYQEVTKGYVDITNPFDVTEGKSAVTREFLAEPMPRDYLAQVGGPEVNAPALHEIAKPSGMSDVEGFMKGEIVKGEYVGEGLTHALERPQGFGDLSFARVKLPIDLDLPLTGPEQFVVEKAIFVKPEDFKLPPMRALEAERIGTSFGTMPRTALLDPELVTPLENPVTRAIYSTPSNISALTIEKLQRASMLPNMAFAFGMLGVQARSSLKLDLGLNINPDLAASLDLSGATLQELTPIQTSKYVQSQRQIPRTIQDLPSEFKQLTPQRYDIPNPFNKDFTLIMSPRKTRGAWNKRYMWEFPVKGPRQTWKKLF